MKTLEDIARIVRKARGEESRADVVNDIGWSNSALRAVEEAKSDMGLTRADGLFRRLGIQVTLGAPRGRKVRM